MRYFPNDIAIYRLCLSTVMDTNEFFVRRNVWMEFWSFMGNKRRTIPYSLVEGKGEREASVDDEL